MFVHICLYFYLLICFLLCVRCRFIGKDPAKGLFGGAHGMDVQPQVILRDVLVVFLRMMRVRMPACLAP